MELAVLLLGLGGCGSPEAPLPPLVAVAHLDVVTNSVLDPDPAYTATCQTGALIEFSAAGSHDPAGRTLTYRWRDRFEGGLSPDFGPGQNPYETPEAETVLVLSSLGVHDVELTVTAPDGRKARTTVSVLVRSCVVCGGG